MPSDKRLFHDPAVVGIFHMRTINAKILFVTAILLTLACLAIVHNYGCGGSNPAAPAVGYLKASSADTDGNILVYGKIFVGDMPLANTAVLVTNRTSGRTSETTANADAFFSTTVKASSGNTINVQYYGTTQGQYSIATMVPIDADLHPLSSGMTPIDVDIGEGDGFAYVLAGDGTNSQLIEVDLITGLIKRTRTFSNIVYDGIGVHHSINHVALLATGASSNNLAWCGLADFSADCTLYTTPSAAKDMTIFDRDNSDPGELDMLFISRDYDETTGGYITAYPILSTNELGTPTNNLSIQHPTGAGWPGPCTGASSPTCVGAKAVDLDLVETAANDAKIAIIVEFANGDHVLYFNKAYMNSSQQILFTSSLETLSTRILDPARSIYEMIWYDEGQLLMTDSTNGQLLDYKTSGWASDIEESVLSVGTTPTCFHPDAANNRVFIANSGTNEIVKVDMPAFQLSGTSYQALYTPDDVVGYSNNSHDHLSVLITNAPSLLMIDVVQ